MFVAVLACTYENKYVHVRMFLSVWICEIEIDIN